MTTLLAPIRDMNKKSFSERDICTKFITPALEKAGWDVSTQIREEFPLTKGRIIVRGKLHTRAQNKRADYVLFHRPNMPIAVIEAKDNKHSIGDGMHVTYLNSLSEQAKNQDASSHSSNDCVDADEKIQHSE